MVAIGMTDTATFLSTLTPMLADTVQGLNLQTLVGTHIFDEKIDGVRAIVGVSQDRDVIVRNRNGRIITPAFPEIELACMDVPGPLVLDGEIVSVDGAFESTSTRARQRHPLDILQGARTSPVTFTSFDVLIHPERGDVRHLPYEQRRALLEALPLYGALTRTMCSPDPALYEQIKAFGGEGVIAKRRDAPYRPGRQRSWIKHKNVQSVSCIVIGCEPGEGAREAMGALFLALWDTATKTVVPCGKVGSGFSPTTAEAMRGLLEQAAVRVSTEGFAALPIVEIECLGRTSGNKLRMPVWKGLRGDLTYADCTTSQLDALPQS